MVARSLLLLIACVAGTSALLQPLAVRRATATMSRAALSMNQRYNDPILNDSLPDPVFDNTEKYKGSSWFGFCATAEAINGRAAMMGFTILFLQELIVGKGVLEQYVRSSSGPSSTLRARALLCPAHRARSQG